jgi:hypothetical protein
MAVSAHAAASGWLSQGRKVLMEACPQGFCTGHGDCRGVLCFSFLCFLPKCHSPLLWTFDAGALIKPVAVRSGEVEVEVGKGFTGWAFLCFVSLVEGALGADVWVSTRTSVSVF